MTLRRNMARAKSIVADDVTKAILLPILRENSAKEAAFYADEAGCAFASSIGGRGPACW